MSTDDSISEDVSSSGALSHCCHGDGEGGGKESETSEGTSHASHTAGGAGPDTPACNKIRSLCLSGEEAFGPGRSLPFINPSSLETLRALVQEIQSSGETDPEIWKDCEGRWLHLFQLVEKQYQEQILAQQEQYQCQIQLIQDEIKALVQIQNRPSSIQPNTEFSPTSATKTSPNSKDYNIFPLLSTDCTIPKHIPCDNDSLAAPVHTLFSSPSTPLQRSSNQCEERATTGLSSGYGTMSAWGTGLETTVSPGEDGDGGGECGQTRDKPHWSPDFQEVTETTLIGSQQQDLSNGRTNPVGGEEPNATVHQQKIQSSSSQALTSWAQRQKLRTKKSKTGTTASQSPEAPEPSDRETHRHVPAQSIDSLDQQRAPGPCSSSLSLRRSDSLMSVASGLTYWRMTESELYHPLPDSFDSGAYLLLQEASDSLEPQLSLREIYQNKQRTDGKRSDWEGSVTTTPSSPQMLTLDPNASNQRQSDRTSGFTSPSHFSSPSFASQPGLHTRVMTPCVTPSVTPDSMVEGQHNHGDTDCISDTSSVSATGPLPPKVQTQQPGSFTSTQQHRASVPLASDEEGSHTHTSTMKTLKPLKPLKPASVPGSDLRSADGPTTERAASLEDPVVLSLLRQNLREKHSRHVADLKAYYESEVQTLRDKLNLRDLPRDLERSNHALAKRCKQLEKALAEAKSRIKELEATNSSLEEKLAEWPERYAVAGATVTTLQQRLEESKRSGKEKDATVTRLRTHVRQLEETVQNACTEAEDKEAHREREYKMLQDLLGEYDALVKEHEGTKNNLVSTENKLVDANDHISDLKRVISKLESQVKQLEHENQARARYTNNHSNTLPSGAGLYHHPDLLLSPSKGQREPDVTRRQRSPCPSEQINGRRAPFAQTNQQSLHKKSQYPPNDQSSGTGSSVDTSGGSWRCASPPECEQSLAQSAGQRDVPRRDGSVAMTPMMRALIELEETRSTQSRAPWGGNQRTTVGFVERRHKESIQERAVGLHDDREPIKARRSPHGGKSQSGGAAALLRAQRSLSPDGHRSSSLPPPLQRTMPPTTPPKRETLLRPLSAKSSPKRCPSENYSTAFGRPMPREEHMHKRFEGEVDPRRLSSSSPRKRLQFTSAEDDFQHPDPSSLTPLPPDGASPSGCEDQSGRGSDRSPLESCDPPSPSLGETLYSLAEAERLFDELTQEKVQVEAALSRMPGAGGRVSLQTRLDEVALENRLETLNRELGSIRMTLKRFHILRSSANI